MARIYRGHDNQLDRDVAVKILRPEYGRDPDFGARFRHEAQAAASLNHPNIVSVYDYGQDTAGPFIVMELVDGEDLASIVKRSGALPPRQAARIAAETARALHAAHQRGIVHRDVKPGNVMIDRDGRVKVADFGIARAIAEAQMTLPGTTLGSVHYSGDAVVGHLLARHRPVRAADRAPPLGGRQRGRRRDGPARRAAARSLGDPIGHPERPRRDRSKGARDRARRSMVVGVVVRRGPRGVPRRRRGAGRGRRDRRRGHHRGADRCGGRRRDLGDRASESRRDPICTRCLRVRASGRCGGRRTPLADAAGPPDRAIAGRRRRAAGHVAR